MYDLAQRWYAQNGTGAHGNTPLHLAASAGHLPIVKALLVAGADAVRASIRLLHGFPKWPKCPDCSGSGDDKRHSKLRMPCLPHHTAQGDPTDMHGHELC